MFETLFTYPGALRRHRDGPLAAERAAYLRDLAAQGVARGDDPAPVLVLPLRCRRVGALATRALLRRA